MPLLAGARLGPYEVLAPLGAGGMGEVYRARDSRLGREVAVKVLPAALASDSERLKRFEREARSASSLNHPNIVTIYDIGSADSVSYIAMELVKGEPLRAELVGGPLPVRRLLQIGTQIAEGLAKAHAAGIVHRDLKPENVMVTEDDHVKILDFGLAKLTQPDSSGGQTTIAPTVSGATKEGVIVGTVGYMSPEQAAGLPVDYRSDQFSFGSILYEMATGKRAFQRASAPQTLTAIIQEEPEPIAALNPKVPVPLRWIVERCLVKEARNRFDSTGDLARDLATVRDRLSEATSAAGVLPAELASSPRRRWWIPAAIVGAVLLAVGLVVCYLNRIDYFWKNPLDGARYTRFTDWEGSELDAAISADGKFVAFTSDRAGPFDVWVGQVGGGEFLNLTRGQFIELANPVIRSIGFSGDGAHVWVHVVDKTNKKSAVWLVPTIGGAPHPFLTNDAVEVAWSPDQSRLAYFTATKDGPIDPIFVADSNGGNPRRIAAPGTHNHYLAWSPDGRFVYCARVSSPSDTDIWRVPAAGGAVERVTSLHSQVGYPTLLDARTLIFVAKRDDSGSGLFAMDVDRRIPHAVTSGLEEYRSVAASGDGRRLVATVTNPTQSLWTSPISDHVVDEPGIRRFDLPTVRATNPRFGPDYLLYLSSRGGPDGLWKFKDGSETELWKGSDGVAAAAPSVSPDGTQIAFVARVQSRGRLYVMTSDGTNAHSIADSLDVRDTPSWSPDGKWVAVCAGVGKEQPLYKVPLDGGAPVSLAAGVNFNPVWSPDGRFIAYARDIGTALNGLRGVTPSGQTFPLPDVRVGYGGSRFRFLPDGKSLIVMQGLLWQQNFWLLDLATGNRRQLTNLEPKYEMKSFDVSPDGKQILFDRVRENSNIVLIDLLPR